MSDPFVTMNRGKKLNFTEREKVEMAFQIFLKAGNERDMTIDDCFLAMEGFISVAKKRLEEE